MTVDTHLDEAIVRQLRAAVADGLTERTSTARIAGGRRLDADDQAALARRLIDDQLEQHARDCIARNEPVLDSEKEAALAQAVYDRLFQLGRLQPLLDDERIMESEPFRMEKVDGESLAFPSAVDTSSCRAWTLGRRARRSTRSVDAVRWMAAAHGAPIVGSGHRHVARRFDYRCRAREVARVRDM